MKRILQQILELEFIIDQSIEKLQNGHPSCLTKSTESVENEENFSISKFNSLVLSCISDHSYFLNQLSLQVEDQNLEKFKPNEKFIYDQKTKNTQFSKRLKEANRLYNKRQREYLMDLPLSIAKKGGKSVRKSSSSKYITQSLERTRKFLVRDISITGDSIHRLAKDAEIMKRNLNTHENLQGDSKEANSIIKSLQKKAVINKILNFVTFVIFLLTAFFVLNKRIPVILLVRKLLTFIIKTIVKSVSSFFSVVSTLWKNGSEMVGFNRNVSEETVVVMNDVNVEDVNIEL